jgi:hypothetical protein
MSTNIHCEVCYSVSYNVTLERRSRNRLAEQYEQDFEPRKIGQSHERVAERCLLSTFVAFVAFVIFVVNTT